MKYKRMPIEVESPEEKGYSNIKYNFAESSIRDKKISNILPDAFGIEFDELVLQYTDHRGRITLRKAIIEKTKNIEIEDVLVCQAAAMALFVVNTSILSKEDHLIVLRPNYATNIETPRAIGCEISFIDLKFENRYQLDITEIKKAIKPNTKLISITTPHNPTGVIIPEKTINELKEIAEEKGIYLLVDQTYRELNFKTEIEPYYAEKSPNIISVSSLSKAYGLPGIRIGWIICKDPVLMEKFLAAKEQIIICNSVVDEYLAEKALKNKAKILSESHTTLNQNFKIVQNWIENHPNFEWVKPDAGAVAFIHFKKPIDTQSFYETLLNTHQTMLGPGHWFEQSDQFFRLGFGFPTAEELEEGIKSLNFSLIIKN
ncbi:MAG: aminotransferase class I/II-fold pyridoxal phosphate-dependent enzyme [Spirosomataceae bacterium]|jgi:aspartate/methionine/tyrosine aminotransferase